MIVVEIFFFDDTRRMSMILPGRDDLSKVSLPPAALKGFTPFHHGTFIPLAWPTLYHVTPKVNVSYIHTWTYTHTGAVYVLTWTYTAFNGSGRPVGGATPIKKNAVADY